MLNSCRRSTTPARTWLAHTAQTRVQAELSKAELSARDADDDPDDRVTAAEWKAAHDAATTEDERHREVTEDDVRDDIPADIDRDRLGSDRDDVNEAGESRRTDVREVADTRPAPVLEDAVRVPEAAETTDHLDHAGRVLDEIRYRDTSQEDAAEGERAAELARWHAEQHNDNDADAFVLDDSSDDSGWAADR